MFRFVDNEPALILQTEAEKILLVSDLHIGYEKSLASKGVKIPSQTPKLYRKMEKIILKHNPDKIILSGDIKHGTAKLLPHEWKDVPEFFEKLLTLKDKIEVVPGNHDGGLKHLLPRNVTLHTTRGVTIQNKEKILITHGHTWPIPTALDSHLIIMGHNHFTVEFKEESGLRKTEPVWMIAQWEPAKIAAAYLRWKKIKYQSDAPSKFREQFNTDIGDPKIVVAPAFNPMLGGTKINRASKNKYISPILESGGVKVDSAEVYLLDQTFIGKTSNIQLSELD